MINHTVMFRLEGEKTAVATAASQFKTALEALPAKIAELDSIAVYIDNSGIAGNWTLTLTARCATFADLAAYSGHPEHLACVAIIKPLVAARACVDTEV